MPNLFRTRPKGHREVSTNDIVRACGHVGCCDDSPMKHATAHFHATTHPVIRSFEPGEAWGFCYVDAHFYDALPNP